MPCTWFFPLVLHEENEEMNGIAREGPARTSFRALTTSRHQPPSSCTRLGPPRVRQNTQKQGCGVLLGHLQTVRRKYSCVQVIENPCFRPIPKLRQNSVCEIYLLTASARLIVISTFSDHRFIVWAKWGGSVTDPPGPTTSVPAGHSDELQLPDQIPF